MKNKSKYHNLIQQDFRIEHLIYYFKFNDYEYNEKINKIFKNLNKLKNKYIEKSNSNRKSNYNIYNEIKKHNLLEEEINNLNISEKENNKMIKDLKIIIKNYNISKDIKYINKTSFNLRKNNYLKLFINELFDYYNNENETYYNFNEKNLFILLKKFIIEFKSFDNLIRIYKNEKFINQKSESVINKSKSLFNNIKIFVEKEETNKKI